MMKADHRPLYIQVIDQLKEEISHYSEGSKLPSEYELAKQLGVSKETLREALRLLEEDGLVVRRYGVGTFVPSKPLFSAGIEELQSVTNMIASANMTPGTIYLSSTIEVSAEEDKARFNRSESFEMLQLERVRTADGMPVVYCLDQLPADLVGNRSIHEMKSIFQFLEEAGRPIAYALASIEPIGYHEHVTEVLECTPETALLLLRQTHYDHHDQAVLHSVNYFRSDKFKFNVVRKSK
ncbi:GntR family transcriptional regulator [Shouchella clausii]|nr:GntR family transcriptional regulator [Shouchella clausii]